MEEQVERGAAMADDNDADFDREAYDQLKQELSMQKKVKEDMLSGTLPRFKPYLRIWETSFAAISKVRLRAI